MVFSLNLKSCLFAGFFVISSLAVAQTKHSSETAYPSYNGLVMAGYQGWFRAEGDGSGAKNYSYGNEDRTGIDMWPNVSEYEKTYETPFRLATGEHARFLCSYDKR